MVDDAVRISEVLALPEVARGGPRVIAGEGLLDRPIRWVHVAETEDVADLLLGGELILTTGMSLRGDGAAAARWIRGLAGQGVAGVVVELGPGLPHVPAAAVRAAADAGLPLVTLDRPVRFVAVTEEMHGRIVNRQLAALRRAEAMERRLTGLLQAGEGVHAVVEVAAAHIGAAVALVLEDGSLLHAAGGEPPREIAPDAPGGVPIPGGGVLRGARLVRAPARSRLTLAELAMLERAAGLVAIVAARTHQERVLGLRERGALLGGLIDGAVAPDVAARRARELGVQPPWRLVPFAARLATRQADPPDATLDVWAGLEGRIRPVLQHLGGGMIGTHSGQGDLLGVVTVREGTTRESAVARIAEALRDGQGASAASVGLAAGAVVTDWGALAEALADTVDALDGARFDAGWTDATLPSLTRLLSSLASDPRLRSFTRRRLAPLDAPTPRAAALRETAQALCAAGGHRADAARSLGIARQSLYRRIVALERVLGVDLGDPVALHRAARRADGARRRRLTSGACEQACDVGRDGVLGGVWSVQP